MEICPLLYSLFYNIFNSLLIQYNFQNIKYFSIFVLPTVWRHKTEMCPIFACRECIILYSWRVFSYTYNEGMAIIDYINWNV